MSPSFNIAHPVSCFLFFLLFKVISEEAYRNWLIMRQEAISAIEMKEELIKDTAAYMENNLTLLGKLKNKSNNERNNLVLRKLLSVKWL